MRARERVVKPRDLARNRVVGNDAVRHVRHLPAQEMHRADGDAGRRGDADELSIHSALPELVADERRQRVERLRRRRGLRRATMIVDPCSAASIITPMMLLPFTSRSSFTIVISLWNFAASFTISAAGRACKPFLFTI